MSEARLVSATPLDPALPGMPATATSPSPSHSNNKEVGECSTWAHNSNEDPEDASETDLAKPEEDDFVKMTEKLFQDKLASLKRQLQQLREGTLPGFQQILKKLDEQCEERIQNAKLLLQLETDRVEKNYAKEMAAATKEFEYKKNELKEKLIAQLKEKKKMIEYEKESTISGRNPNRVEPIMTRQLRRRLQDPVPTPPDKRRKLAPAQLNYLLTDKEIAEDLRTLKKLKSPKRPASRSSSKRLPATPAEPPAESSAEPSAERFDAWIEYGKLYYGKSW